MKYSIACLILLTAFLSISVSSCKKGCTNAKAMNYNPDADQEDASCLFCDSIIVDTYSGYRDMDDSKSSSVHYRDMVLRSRAIGNLYKYEGNNCASAGLVSNCSDPRATTRNFAHIDFLLINLIEDTLVLNGQFRVSINGGDLRYFNLNNFTIPPYDSIIYSEHYYQECIQSSFASADFIDITSSFSYK